MAKYRSKFETTLAGRLATARIPFEYERDSFKIRMPSTKAECVNCGSRVTTTIVTYTPDFFIGDLVIEAKGKLTAKERKKYAEFVRQYPHIKYRLVFMRDNKIHPKSKTRYSDWATSIGVPYSIGTFSKQMWKEIKLAATRK